MTATKVKTWPTFEEADQVVAKLSEAYAAVDGFMVSCHALLPVDDSPWERPDDTPVPTVEDVAALAWLAMNVRLHVRAMAMPSRCFAGRRSAISYSHPRPRSRRVGEDNGDKAIPGRASAGPGYSGPPWAKGGRPAGGIRRSRVSAG